MPSLSFPEQLYSLLYEAAKQFDGSVEQEFLARAAPETIAKTAEEITTSTEQLFAAFWVKERTKAMLDAIRLLSAIIFLAGIVSTINVGAPRSKVTAVGEKRRIFLLHRSSALEDAKRTVKKVVASFPKSKKRMFKDLEESIYENIDDFVIEAAIQQKKNDAGTKIFKVAISALVDVDAINAFFIDNSEAGNQEAGDASDFGAIFVARVEMSRKTFKVKNTNVSKSESQSNVTEETASDGTTSLDSTKVTTVDVSQSGGSSKKKRDAVEYEASTELSAELAFAVEEQLVDAGFEPMDAEDLADNYDLPYLEDIVDQGLLRKNGSFPKN